MDGYYVDTYTDKARDSAFLDYLERGDEDPNKNVYSNQEARNQLVGEDQLYKTFKGKMDYDALFDEWYQKENNGLEKKIR